MWFIQYQILSKHTHRHIYNVVDIIVNNFLITAQIHVKICVWYIDPMGISIHINFIKTFRQKVIMKNTFSRVEISIRQFWKFVFNGKIVQNSIFTFIPFHL